MGNNRNSASNIDLVEVNNATRTKINKKFIKEIGQKFLSLFKIKQPVSIALVGDQTIQKLNCRYRGRNKVTDVLAFPDDNNFLGEIIIDYAQIKRQAKLLNRGIKEELAFVLIHGLLHLVGFRDDTTAGKKKMLKLGEEIIKIIQTKK